MFKIEFNDCFAIFVLLHTEAGIEFFPGLGLKPADCLCPSVRDQLGKLGYIQTFLCNFSH